MSTYFILIVMTIMGAFAALFLKQATKVGLKRVMYDRNFYFGVILYLCSAVLNIYVLKFLEYSIVLPFTAITYVWTMMISGMVLKENITVKKKVGVGFIIVGVMMIV